MHFWFGFGGVERLLRATQEQLSIEMNEKRVIIIIIIERKACAASAAGRTGGRPDPRARVLALQGRTEQCSALCARRAGPKEK